MLSLKSRWYTWVRRNCIRMSRIRQDIIAWLVIVSQRLWCYFISLIRILQNNQRKRTSWWILTRRNHPNRRISSLRRNNPLWRACSCSVWWGIPCCGGHTQSNSFKIIKCIFYINLNFSRFFANSSSNWVCNLILITYYFGYRFYRYTYFIELSRLFL